MSDARKPTYDQLSALCAQMAAALEEAHDTIEADLHDGPTLRRIKSALTAYRTLSPDPQWQRVPEGCVVVPMEPTQEMVSACEPGPYGVAHIFRDMVSAHCNRARGEG